MSDSYCPDAVLLGDLSPQASARAANREALRRRDALQQMISRDDARDQGHPLLTVEQRAAPTRQAQDDLLRLAGGRDKAGGRDLDRVRGRTVCARRCGIRACIDVVSA